VSKHPLGYGIMKGIMDGESRQSSEEVPLFEFSVETEPGLFDDDPPTLEELRADLLKAFAGRKIRMIEIFERHNVGTSYVPRNYKRVLLDLERDGVIRAEADGRRKPNTFGNDVRAIFPKE